MRLRLAREAERFRGGGGRGCLSNKRQDDIKMTMTVTVVTRLLNHTHKALHGTYQSQNVHHEFSHTRIGQEQTPPEADISYHQLPSVILHRLASPQTLTIPPTRWCVFPILYTILSSLLIYSYPPTPPFTTTSHTGTVPVGKAGIVLAHCLWHRHAGESAISTCRTAGHCPRATHSQLHWLMQPLMHATSLLRHWGHEGG